MSFLVWKTKWRGSQETIKLCCFYLFIHSLKTLYGTLNRYLLNSVDSLTTLQTVQVGWSLRRWSPGQGGHRRRPAADDSPTVPASTSYRTRPTCTHCPPWTRLRPTARRWTPASAAPSPCMPRPVDDLWRGRCRRGRECDWCSCRSHRLPGRRPVSRQRSNPRRTRNWQTSGRFPCRWFPLHLHRSWIRK